MGMAMPSLRYGPRCRGFAGEPLRVSGVAGIAIAERVWVSNNTGCEPPSDAPWMFCDGLTPFERMARDFRRLQERGW